MALTFQLSLKRDLPDDEEVFCLLPFWVISFSGMMIWSSSAEETDSCGSDIRMHLQLFNAYGFSIEEVLVKAYAAQKKYVLNQFWFLNRVHFK